MKHYAGLLKRALKLLSMSLRRRVDIGNERFVIHGSYLNRLAVATTATREEWLDDAYRTILTTKEGTFLDVGTNVGQTMIKILALDRHRQYIGFEPQISCCFFMERFLSENGLSTHKIFPIGLSDRQGVETLLMRKSSGASASLVERFRPGSFYSHQVDVPTIAGDDILATLDPPSIAAIKVDVEGGELEVIEGLLSSIEKYRPYIVFEVLNHYLAITDEMIDDETVAFRDQRAAKLETAIRNHRYVIYGFGTEKAIEKVERITPERSNDQTSTDYLAIPSEDERRFLEGYARASVDA